MHTALIYDEKKDWLVKINVSDTTLRTSKFRAGHCEVLFSTCCNTYFYCVIWIVCDGCGEDTTVSIVTAKFESNEYFNSLQ
jgi:hypothetical protein